MSGYNKRTFKQNELTIHHLNAINASPEQPQHRVTQWMNVTDP